MNLGAILIYLFFIVLVLIIFLLIWPFCIYIRIYAGLRKIDLKVQVRLTPKGFNIYKKEWKWASLYPNEEEELENKVDLKSLLNGSDNKNDKGKKLIKKLIGMKLEVYSFNWFTIFGLSDPATTAISYGALWVVKSLVFRYISRRFKLYRGRENYTYDIRPDLEKLNVSSQLDCILKLPRGYDILRVMLK